MPSLRNSCLLLSLLFPTLSVGDPATLSHQFKRINGHDISYTSQGWLRVYSKYTEYPDHFFLDADINEGRYRFIIDTGANSVFVPYEMAKNLNLECNPIMTQTASSELRACSAIIDKMDISGIVIKNVHVAYPLEDLSKHAEPWPLLGMDVLKRLQVKYVNNKLYLKPASNATYAQWLIKCIKEGNAACPDPLRATRQHP